MFFIHSDEETIADLNKTISQNQLGKSKQTVSYPLIRITHSALKKFWKKRL